MHVYILPEQKTAVFFSLILRIELFGSTVLIPQFLQTSLGYTAERAGMALFASGVVLMLMMSIGGWLTSSKIDPRQLICVEFLGTALTLHRFTIIHLQIDFHTIVKLRAAQVLFLPLIFIPISTLNHVGVPREKNNQVSGLSNFARNLGGRIGMSLLTTFLARQSPFHQVNFAAHAGRVGLNLEQWMDGTDWGFCRPKIRLGNGNAEGPSLGLRRDTTPSRHTQFSK